MQAVMYHYVRPNTDRPPHQYYYLDLDDFRRQLDHFESEYHLIGRETFLSYLTDDADLPADGMILTFDDGLRDHYEWVLPELQRRGLWGVFFVSGPLEARLLPVHRIHSFLGSADIEELLDAFEDIVDEADIRDETVDEFRKVYSEYDSRARTRRFKRTLNYLVPYDRLTQLLNELEERVSDLDRIDPAEYYLTREQLREISDSGMLIGGHTVTHPALSRLPPGSQREEIRRSLEYVRDVANPPVQAFAYPYGGTEMYDETTVEILREHDCDIAFTTEVGDISSGDFQRNPLTLPRRDCNEFEYGSASIA